MLMCKGVMKQTIGVLPKGLPLRVVLGNGDQPLPVIAPVSLAGTAHNASPTLKDPKFWTAKEKKTRKIDRLARSLLIQGLPNDIYSLIDSNKTTKDLWDALERQMCGSEYAKQDKKAAILYEYETFKVTKGEQLLDTYLRYLQVINDLNKCGYKKDNCELNYKFLNNLQLEWKQYGTLMRQTKNLMDINIDALYNILKQNQGNVNDALGYKKKAIVVTSDPLAMVAEKTKVSKRKKKVEIQIESEGSDDDDITSSSANKKPKYVKSVEKKEDKKANEKKRDMSKVKCYNCKKEGYFARDCKKAKEINANMVFMAQTKKVLLDSDESSSSAEETIAEVAYYTSDSESEYEYETSEYYDNSTNYDFEKIDPLFQQTSSLRPYVLTVILQKIIIDLKDEVVSLLEKEKANLKTIDSLKSKSFESSENAIFELKNQSENDCQVVEKECDLEISKVIAPGMFKLSVSQSVSPILMSKTSCDSKNVENKTKRIRRKRKSSKQNNKQVNNVVSRDNSKFVYFSDLDTFSSVRRPKHNNVIWKKKGSSNTSNVYLSYVSHLKLNKDIKRYSHKDLLSCNNSHLGETSSAYVCNDAMNVSCNSRLCDLFDENNLFIFDDESVRISPVSKMPFRKKPRDSMNVHSKSNSNKSLPRTVHRWFPKMQPLAGPVAKWIPRVERQTDKISKTPDSSGPIFKWVPKHMTGNRALLTNFMEKFLGTVHFANNDFAVIAGYGDVIPHRLKVNQSILLVVLDVNPSAPVVSVAKLPILNPNEFYLWKMRIKQYFLLTDYSLWEVIINGDSVTPRVAVDGVAQPVIVLTAEQKLARKNELKAR
nr:hypothetical protein [Tanacetum cinerariifolium]